MPLNKHCMNTIDEGLCGHRTPAGTGVRPVASTCMCVCVRVRACVYLEEWKGVNEGGAGNHLLDLQLSQLAGGSILTPFSKSYIL